MAKRRRKRSASGGAEAAPGPDARARFAKAFLGIGIAATAFLVDSGADSSFDAPKRLIALLAVAAAGTAAFAFPSARSRLGTRPPNVLLRAGDSLAASRMLERVFGGGPYGPPDPLPLVRRSSATPPRGQGLGDRKVPRLRVPALPLSLRPRRARDGRYSDRLLGGVFPEGPPARRLALAFLLAALGAALLSALLSPRRPESLDAMRTILLTALLLPLGASRVLERPKPLLALFLAGAGANAAVSLLQASGRFQPFTLKTWGNREATGAFVGNVGYLALFLALAAVLSLAIALAARSGPLRAAAGASALLSLAGILVNQNLTAVLAFAAGALVLLGRHYGRRSILPVAAAALLVAAGVAAYPPLRARAGQAVAAARAGEWDRLLTYRVGAWAAALEMIRERPALGFGPGTFGSEFVPHRLKAEIRHRERFVNPLVTSSYAETHSDYLQAFAEGGAIAGAAAVGAALLLLVATAAAAKGKEGARRAEATVLLALLAAGATAALTWFPLQRPITAIPLLLAAGRAWKISAAQDTARRLSS